ncbi:Jumonji domain containing 6 (Silurana) [Caligus rogercresseyi]|uniref:Jumonji domain containing 6 (Silurana) n=1 Tax=Caligus rogercresseyi TaxID=217165 RepID=A0A7T8HJP0_CALRO|nr:Jumonji domain containing 6 (Silurana) [Caligus rogercresseyi]
MGICLENVFLYIHEKTGAVGWTVQSRMSRILSVEGIDPLPGTPTILPKFLKEQYETQE